MKYPIPACAVLLASAVLAQGEAPILYSSDFFNQPGEYYRAYNNVYDTQDDAVNVAGRILPAGPDLFWDFSFGPTEVTNRYDYLDATDVPQAADFPGATIAELKTNEETGAAEYLFFDQPEGSGRTVYGLYSETLSMDTPSVVLQPAVEDFPDTIYYGRTWENRFSYDFSLFFAGEEGSALFPTRTDVVSQFEVDAYGTVWLPELGLLDALRVQEFKTEDIWFDYALLPDDPPQWVHAATAQTRVYRWLSPGHGIVVQISSEATITGTPPDEEFALAAVFERMFETNKESVPVNNDPKPVENLGVTPSNGKIVIHWQAAANASAYRVEYCTGGLGSNTWEPLVERTTGFSVLDPAGLAGGETRFYRVISLR